jgi:hypothetical protein
MIDDFIGSLRQSDHQSSNKCSSIQAGEHTVMCRNIKTLANFCPPATDDEIRASALQFVRKLSGMNRPSRANDAAFNRAVDEVTEAAQRLIHSLTTSAPPRNREEEARRAQERARLRFASGPRV